MGPFMNYVGSLNKMEVVDQMLRFVNSAKVRVDAKNVDKIK